MNTPFYPENYDIIEGCKVYTFYVEPMYKAGKDVYPKKPRRTIASAIKAAEDSFCTAVAKLITSSRRRTALPDPEDRSCLHTALRNICNDKFLFLHLKTAERIRPLRCFFVV